MTNHRTPRLRVDAPTLEPDPVFLGALAELGASSRPAIPRTARSAGLRLLVAAASVAVIAGATWAVGAPNGRDIPLSPADAPAPQEPSGPPSHGNVGTPQPDVTTSPGSPLSPGLPGTPSSGAEHASDRGAGRGTSEVHPTHPPGRSGEAPRSPEGEDNGKYDEDHGGGREQDDRGDRGDQGDQGDGDDRGDRDGRGGRDAEETRRGADDGAVKKDR